MIPDSDHRQVEKTPGIKIALIDKPENILERIIFLDIDSTPKKKFFQKKKSHLKEIKKDITYFGRSYHRVDFQVNITGLKVDKSAIKTIEALRDYTRIN